MAHQVTMPQMGESIAEGTITQWLKKVGDRVEKDQPLFEISTDKVDAEIPSPVAGTLLEIKVQPGDAVPIDSVVAVIGEAGEKPGAGAAKPAPAPAEPVRAAAAPTAAPAPAEKPPAPPAAAAPAAAPPTPPSGGRTSPLVRRIAADRGVDLHGVPGTGIGGRVTKDDLLAHIDAGAQADGATAAASRGAAAPPGPRAPAGAAPGAPAAPAAAAQALEVPEAYRARAFEGDRTENLSAMRVKIGEHMVMSRRISPHVATVWDVDFSHIARLRAKHKAAWAEQHGVNLTYTAFILKACIEALRAFPACNASLDGQRAIYHRHINLGMAVALDWGLLVPVIHKADELNLLGLARRAADLAARARSKKLKPDEAQNGTFTVTNPGVFGSQFSLPVINQPQVGIVGVGCVEKRPVVVDDALAIRTRCTLSMSFDHRMIDGALADQFMGRIKTCLEEFDAREL